MSRVSSAGEEPGSPGDLASSVGEIDGLMSDADLQRELERQAGEPWSSWDVCNAQGDIRGVSRLSMIVPAVTRIAFNAVAAPLVVASLAAGKATEKITHTKPTDTRLFRIQLRNWMYANGMWPEIIYEELRPETVKALREWFPDTQDPTHINSTPIMVSNHICYMDGIVIAGSFGAPRAVAMKESAKVPVVGPFMEQMDMLWVDRNSGDSRQAILQAIKSHCDEWQVGSRPLLIFPEGKTSNGEDLLPFKKGAFVPGKPVRPLLIVYTGEWNPSAVAKREVETGVYEEASEVEWGKQFFGHFIHSMHVRILEPYIPDAAEQKDPSVYAHNVHRYMQRRLAEVRQEVYQKSWKAAAGRAEGPLDFQPLDIARIAKRKTQEKLQDLEDGKNEVKRVVGEAIEELPTVGEAVGRVSSLIRSPLSLFRQEDSDSQ